MPDFPVAVTDLPDASESETLLTMHAGVSHVTATNRLIANVRNLSSKLGLVASSPAANTVLRGTAIGSSAFGQVQPGDISPGTGNANRTLMVNPAGSAFAYATVPSGGMNGPGAGSTNTVARTTDGTNVVYGKVTSNDILDGTIAPADIAAGGVADMLLGTVNGTQAVMTKVTTAMVPALALNASSLFGGGTGNRVLRTNDGTNALWGQVGTPDIAAQAVSQSAVGSMLAGGTYNGASALCVMSSQCQLTTTGGPVLVMAYLTVYETSAGGIGQVFSATLTLDGTGFTYAQSVTAAGVSYSTPVAIMAMVTPAAGLHTFCVNIQTTNGYVWTVSAGQVSAVEFKR